MYLNNPSSQETADKIVEHIILTESYLSVLPEKSPQPRLNHALETLVEMVRPEYEADFVGAVLSDHNVNRKVGSLRYNLSECEYELEKHWASKIIKEGSHYTDYPYIESYRALVDSEIELLGRFNLKQIKSVCFVGSGPMPITAFEMKKIFPEIALSCVEREKEALILSKDVSVSSGIEIQYIHAEAAQADYSCYDVVFIASMTTDKKSVFEQIVKTARVDTLIGARSVDKLRHILYEPIDPNDVPQQFNYLGKTIYKPQHINTTLLYKLEK